MTYECQRMNLPTNFKNTSVTITYATQKKMFHM